MDDFYRNYVLIDILDYVLSKALYHVNYIDACKAYNFLFIGSATNLDMLTESGPQLFEYYRRPHLNKLHRDLEAVFLKQQFLEYVCLL